MKVPVEFFLLHADTFEEKRLALHTDCQVCHFPIAGSYLSPLYAELPAFFQVTEQAAGKLHIIHQLAMDTHEPLLFRVDPDFALHFSEYLCLTRGVRELRIGFKRDFDQITAFAGVLEKKSVWDHLHEGVRLLSIFPATLFKPFLRLGVVG